MMKGIHVRKIWFDDDVVELRVTVNDGRSLFSTDVYVGHEQLAEDVSGLNVFKTHVYGGLFNLRWGEFGPEYAGGAIHARLHFPKPGRLFITCKMQSEFEEFTVNKVASEATLLLRTEPALLDRFIGELGALSSGMSEEAEMETIQQSPPPYSSPAAGSESGEA